MARIVRPGSWIVFLEPNPFSLSYYIQMMITPGMTWAGERGLVRMRRASVFEAMDNAGLIHPRLERFGLFPPVLADRSWPPLIERRAETCSAGPEVWRFRCSRLVARYRLDHGPGCQRC